MQTIIIPPMCSWEIDKQAELLQALQVYQRDNNLMTKSTNGRTSIRMHGVLMVQTSSGTGWTSCSTAGTRTMLCQAATAVTLMWCWLLYYHLDGDSRKVLVLPHSETQAAVRRAEYHWTDGSSPGTQCGIYNTIRAANSVSGAFP